MTSIDSVNGSGTGLTLLQQLLELQRTDTDNTSSGRVGRGGDSKRLGFDAKLGEAAVAAGLDADSLSDVRDEIESAIAAAKETAGDASDPGQAIREAIDGVLEKHGVDLEKFRSELQAGMGAGGTPPAGPPPTGGPRGAQSESAFDEAAIAAGLDSDYLDELHEKINSIIDEAMSNSDDETDARQSIQSAIDSLLEEYGVNLDEFKSQMQSGMSGTQGSLPLLDEQA